MRPLCRPPKATTEKDQENCSDDGCGDSAQKIRPKDDRELGYDEQKLCQCAQAGNPCARDQ